LSSGERRREPFRFGLRVYYEDTDAGGIVYYANYLKYMERARTEWLSSLGHELSSLERVEGIVFVVHRVEIDYRIPAKLGERIDVTVALVELNRASMLVEQDVMRDADALTHARVGLACLALEGRRPTRIPAALYDCLERLP
jgi:acyl-CoA thioester hydrolase